MINLPPTSAPEFVGMGKIPRLCRPCTTTEKIDGTNAQVYIVPDASGPMDLSLAIADVNTLDLDEACLSSQRYAVFAGSRKSWLTREKDNFGFANWVSQHVGELVLGLGPGRHFGEWWGHGINRGYDCVPGERYFSLINVTRWDRATHEWYEDYKTAQWDKYERRLFAPPPPCCQTVPVLGKHPSFAQLADCGFVFERLRKEGSQAKPGYMNPEGIVIFHVQGNVLFKVTFEKDQVGKGE